MLTCFAFNLNAQNCPPTVSPVVGSNGVTYLNACYAQAAGINNYTSGFGFGSCIDASAISPDPDCEYDGYEPVCGCNNVTYANACTADAAGVTKYNTGPCNEKCLDVNSSVTGAMTRLSAQTGVLNMNCSTDTVLVCGCDGITYVNPCVAQASGITFYTYGDCDSDCINPDEMDAYANCVANSDPVCGCNNQTYANPCSAEASGVETYNPGACATSTWCSTASLIHCGDFLSNESTSGASNTINAYPGCVNGSMAGGDKIYKIHKTSTGDLQIGLEILSPGLDLDLFLLSDNCSTVSCIKKSTGNNANSNNEGILLEDAPLGVYYIVVDGQYASSVGSFNLEVSCGFLDCTDATYMTCGQSISSSNIDGGDNVSLYTCGNTINVENNGPEKVHRFSITTGGNISISLTGLTQNLEMFLLNSCDRGACVASSANAGTSNESISTYLNPGTYFIVVDGYNGAISDYDLSISCPTSCYCSLNFTAYSSDAGCGSNNGKIILNASGGTAPFLVSWSGTSSGSFTSYSNNITIPSLSAGIYHVTLQDAYGCTRTKTITIGSSGSSFDFWLTANDSGCGSAGSINVEISGNGSPPYTIYVSGPTSGVWTKYNNNFSIDNLAPGTYTVCIVDSQGCTRTKTITIGQGGGGSCTAVMTPVAAQCESLGKIHVSLSGCTPVYCLYITGPVSGGAYTHRNSFNIINLPAGTYTIEIHDANGCSVTQVVTVASEELDVHTYAQNGSCGTSGAINVSMNNGSPGYNISWNGPVSGSQTTNGNNYTINNLPPGNYSITVMDANWCTDYSVVHVGSGSGNNLGITGSVTNAGCNGSGSIWLDIANGSAPYQIHWSGPVSGNTNIYNNGYDITNLPAGYYTVTVTDANGCSGTKQFHVQGGSGTINTVFNIYHGSCNSSGSVGIDIIGGTAPYSIQWTGPVNGNTTSTSTWVDITNLPQGTYWFKVTDANGCSKSQYITINGSNGNASITAQAQNGSCGNTGSITGTVDGASPYRIDYTGPSNGTFNTAANGFTIPNLVSGTYTVKVTDANGCTATKTVQIYNNQTQLDVTGTAGPASCTGSGNIWLNINNGTAPYVITWSGPQSGSVTTSSNGFDILDLAPGTYTVTVVDANGCSKTVTFLVPSSGGSIDFQSMVMAAGCNMFGSIWINQVTGVPPFVFTWTGPISGTHTTANNAYDINNLPGGIYTVTVTDGNGCSKTETFDLGNGNVLPVAGFTTVIDGLEVSFTNTSDGTSFNWTFGDGASSMEESPTYGYCDPGDYTVCQIATNDCGSDTICQQISVAYPANKIILNVGTAAAENNALALVPVYIFNTDNIVSLTASLQTEIAALGQVQGVTAGLIAPTYNGTNQSINYFSNQAVTVTDGDLLFYINVLMTGNAGDQTRVSLVDNPVPIEIATSINGMVDIRPHVAIHGFSQVVSQGACYGRVNNFNGTPIANVELNLASIHNAVQEATDNDGDFKFDNLSMEESFMLNPSKIDNPMNGLSTRALYTGQQFLLGMEPSAIQSPYQIIAADANCNASFTGLDLYFIQQVLLKNEDEFPVCNNWKFINQDYEMEDEISAYNVFNFQSYDSVFTDGPINRNFTGVKIGDLLGQANTTAYNGPEAINYNGDLELTTAQVAAVHGEIFEIPFYANNFTGIEDLQFALKFDTDKLELKEVISSANVDLSNLASGTTDSEDGLIYFSWFNVNGQFSTIDNSTPLFTLKFQAKEFLQSDFEYFSIDMDHMSPVAHNVINQNLNIDINNQTTVATNNPTLLDFSLSNFPNPFTNETDIEFDLPTSSDAVVRIQDELGRIIWALDGSFVKGNNKIKVNTSKWAAGMYYYSILIDEGIVTNKMLLVR